MSEGLDKWYYPVDLRQDRIEVVEEERSSYTVQKLLNGQETNPISLALDGHFQLSCLKAAPVAVAGQVDRQEL